VAVGNVYFEPCSRTYWHSHGEGRLLIIVSGEGFVAAGNEVVAERAGDMVWTPEGTALAPCVTGRFMLHTAVTLGVTV
jgi:quercetin dioxygenase-like cupin family protein